MDLVRALARAPLTGPPLRAVRPRAADQWAGAAQQPGAPVPEAAHLPRASSSASSSSQSSNVVPLKRAGGRDQPSSRVEPAPQPPAALPPRILQVQSAAELSHMAQCHPARLLVVHFASPGCKLDEAFRPALQRACAKHPAALFLAIAVQPGEVAAAASPASLAAAAAAPGPPPGSPAEQVELLQGLSIAALPCTLLMRGGQLLARLEMRSGSAGSGDNCSSHATPVAEAAAAAAAGLQAAMQAAQPRAASGAH